MIIVSLGYRTGPPSAGRAYEKKVAVARTRNYLHFCPVARSLEVIGEKWSLLIVRDLLGGERRFTDLLRGLNNITPKWLTLRLREMEEAGIVERAHEEGKREVWYRLTPKGRELAGVIAELNTWGLRYAMRPPLEDELVGDSRFGRSLLGYLNRCDVKLDRPRDWRITFSTTRTAYFHFDGTEWTRDECATPDVDVRTNAREWASVLGEDPVAKRARLDAMDITGDEAAIAEFVDILCAMVAEAVPA